MLTWLKLRSWNNSRALRWNSERLSTTRTLCCAHATTADGPGLGSCVERLLLCDFLVAQNEPLQFATGCLGQVFDELDFPRVRVCGQALPDMQAQDSTNAWVGIPR
jgi:hypothetical protein